MDAVVIGALDPGSRTVKFGQPGNVKKLGPAEKLGYLLAHGARRPLGSVDHLANLDLRGKAALMNFFSQQKAHGSRAAQDGGLHVAHELALQIDIARPGGQGHGAEFLTSGLKTEPGRPNAITDRDLDTILGR